MFQDCEAQVSEQEHLHLRGPKKCTTHLFRPEPYDVDELTHEEMEEMLIQIEEKFGPRKSKMLLRLMKAKTVSEIDTRLYPRFRRLFLAIIRKESSP